MSGFLSFMLVCVMIADGGIVSSQNIPPPRSPQPPRGGGGGGGSFFNCPSQERGQYENPADCTRFYQCDGGVSTLMSCPAQLLFNPRTSLCDYPYNVQNPNCATGESPLSAQTRDICRNNPGVPDQAFIVGHPEICNAFYTCSTSYLYNPCSFCGEFEYFSAEARGCRNYQTLGVDRETLCQGRRFVEHADKVFEQLMSCWPFAQNPNPFLSLMASFRTSTPGPQRPG